MTPGGVSQVVTTGKMRVLRGEHAAEACAGALSGDKQGSDRPGTKCISNG